MDPVNFIGAVLFLGLLIFVHESGHFVAAKAFGVRVITFSFGFGRRLLGLTHKGTDYRISLIPFGGYVRLAGADPFEEEEEEQERTELAWQELEEAVPELPDSITEPSERASAAAQEEPAPSFGSSIQDVSVWKRLVIYAAGPAFNLVVPFFLFSVLLMAGEPQLAAVAGTVVSESPAERAGIQPGDRILQVAGRSVRTWVEMSEAWAEAGASSLELLVERAGEQLAVTLQGDQGQDQFGPADFGIRLEVPSTEVGLLSPRSPAGLAGLETGDRLRSVDGQQVLSWSDVEAQLRRADDDVELTWERDGEEQRATLVASEAWIPEAARRWLDDLEFERWGLQTATLVVAAVAEESAAARAGIVEGDFLLAIDERRVGSWHEVLQDIAGCMVGEGERSEARAVSMAILHGGELSWLDLQPEVIEDTDALGRYYYRPIIGVTRLGGWAEGPTVRVYYSPGRALMRAGEESVLLVRFTLVQLGRIVTGQVAPQASLGGPVEIMRQASAAADKGLFDIARLLGMISISVGIFNLLPVPVLDGGHLLFYTLEAIRGRPVSVVVRERAQIIGVMLLVALMLFVLVVDVNRLFGGPG